MDAGTVQAAPGALAQFVLKIHSRCDLACDHCYVFESVDQSWRRRPLTMTADTVRMAALRLAEHANAHALPRVTVVLHGGEPLLVGADGLAAIATQLRAELEPVTRLDLRMQSNGVLLDRRMCQVLLEHDIRVGISLDGDRASNDRHRRFARGASSYESVLRGLSLLREPEFRRIYAGILCTIDIRNDPIAVYEALLAQEPPRIDLLLPHATWDRPPLGQDSAPTPYAEWLLRIFRRWSADGQPVPIRTFDSVKATGRGGRSGTEALGLDEVDLAVIEADGTWEQVDSLKVTVDSGPATGLDVFRHTVDEVAAFPAIARRRTGLADLSPTCRACPVVRQCGGGLFTHRYRTGSGFDNPSVYCADLKELIVGINEHVAGPIAHAVSAGGVSAGEIDALGLAVFDTVASGYGDELAVRRLADLQVAITRTLLAAVAERAPADGWRLLLEVERAAPWAVHEVLRHPYVRAWAVACLSSADGRADYVGSIALASAIRGGVAAELEVPAFNGAIFLPTVGVVDRPESASAAVAATPGGLRVRGGATIDLVAATPVPGWSPAARAALDGHNVVIEDSDPFRECHQWPTSGRLEEAARERWRRSIDDAWQVVQADAPQFVAGLAAGLRAVTPVVPAPDGSHRASSSRNAFGAVAVAPAPADSLAVMLVHEFQHAKLAALLDVVDLVDPGHPGRLVVGWRPDPRPPVAVLHGIYAHLAVAEIWRVRAERDGREREAAAATFRQYRDWTSDATCQLREMGALTPAGTRLLGLLGATMAGWK